jgi:multicomponent Na+:H+ antiporter subunit A
MFLAAAVLSAFVVAIIAPAVCRLTRGACGWVLAILPLVLVTFFAGHIPQVYRGIHLAESIAWAQGLDLELAFNLDGLGLLFALLICGIGTLIFIYGGGYLRGHRHIGRFFVILLLFMGSMLGIVLADNLAALYVFWELTTITSYLLIGFDHENPVARKSAWQSLMVTGSGGLALLAGLVLLGQAADTYSISQLLERGEMIRGSALYTPALVLILIGAFAKSAQFPFHFWLPNAMTAPTPVSAYLHSATMVKAGIYLMARLSPALAGTHLWHVIVIGGGGITMLIGGYLALNKTDLKQVLAYSTVSALGTITLLLGIGTPEAAQAAMVFLMAHAMYKGALFMVAGTIDHETGTRDVELVGGLRKEMPITATAGMLAAISLAGFGPVLSFIGKEMLFEAVLHSEEFRWMLVPAVVLAGALFVAVAGIVGVRPFFGDYHAPHHAHEAPPSLWLGPMLLALAGFILGTIPGTGAPLLLEPAVASINPAAGELHLVLWHGLNIALMLSVVSLLVGVSLYIAWEHLRRGMNRLRIILEWGPARWYELIMASMNGIARTQTRLLQSGYLPRYVLLTLAAAMLLIGFTFFTHARMPLTLSFAGVRFYEISLAMIILLGTIVAMFTRSPLVAIASLAVVGFGVALIFVLYGAPDLAMTQLLIETLTVILLVLIFYHLPGFTIEPKPVRQIRDAMLASLAGVLVTVLVLAIGIVPTDMTLIEYYAQNTYLLGHGRNIVNVILVDFRGIDTMGEITVLAIAGVGIYALLRLRPRVGRSG